MPAFNVTLFRGRYVRLVIYALLLVWVWYFFSSRNFMASADNDFELSGALVPVEQIEHGGPPRDGIPSIDKPRFVEAAATDFLGDDDRVLGMQRQGVTKAYPVRILNFHEIVNDRFGGESVVVTYCPLCASGMAFLGRVAGVDRSFGVSGLLYNSDVLLYDRQSESLWSQLLGKAISGPLKGTRLTPLVLEHTTWGDWRSRHPETLVLSERTGSFRSYGFSPYDGYENSEDIWYSVSASDKRYHPKELVIGVELDGVFKAYPFVELSGSEARIADRVGGRPIHIEFDAEHRTGRVQDTDGQAIPSVIVYWFAWYAFHPDTAVFRADQE